MIKQANFLTAIALPVMMLLGCPMEDEDDGGDDGAEVGSSASSSSSSEGSGGESTGSIDQRRLSGWVVRTTDPAGDGDGVGTIYIAAFESCALDAPLLGLSVLPAADLSADASQVDYAIEGLPPTSVHLALFLDDDGNADPAMPGPDIGDLVYAETVGDGILSCIVVDLGVGDAIDVELPLNAIADPG